MNFYNFSSRRFSFGWISTYNENMYLLHYVKPSHTATLLYRYYN